MRCIYILDKDQSFGSRLAHALAKHCQGYRFLSLKSPDDFYRFQHDLGQEALMLLYTKDHFPQWQVPDGLDCLILRSKPKLTDLYDKKMTVISETENDVTNDDSNNEPSIYRLAGILDIAHFLKEHLQGFTDNKREPLLKTYILYSPTPGRMANRSWERILASEMDTGRRIVGLPLTPAYLLTSPSLLLADQVADRQDLSSLLLRLEYASVDPKEVLAYLQPTRMGCLSIGATDGIDDINEASGEVLIRFITLMQEALQISQEESTLTLLCTGLSIRRLAQLLTCTNEFITVTDPEAIQKDAWIATLNTLLSALPAGVKHRELWEGD